MDERTVVARSWSAASVGPGGPLTADELWRLTLYKWRYSLESQGFSADQTRHLLFLKWLYGRRVTLR